MRHPRGKSSKKTKFPQLISLEEIDYKQESGLHRTRGDRVWRQAPLDVAMQSDFEEVKKPDEGKPPDTLTLIRRYHTQLTRLGAKMELRSSIMATLWRDRSFKALDRAEEKQRQDKAVYDKIKTSLAALEARLMRSFRLSSQEPPLGDTSRSFGGARGPGHSLN